ncbi:thioredoxin reductase [Firmicutes bacterium CAG:884]|nr:FAD-dependent oxidoreductase [Bacillota bacterium]CCY93316.1 thioredoxin reductase [Firmicutes bacterium CAG:884]
MPVKSSFDCIIIGAGIAGLTAAIYLKRAGKNVVIIEKSMPGGQILKTNSIKNYPGFLEIDGFGLIRRVLDQTDNLNIKIIKEEVLEINNLEVKTNKNTYQTKNIILATGRKPRILGLENEEELIGKGISFCASCDGNLYKNENVAVVGGGNTAFEDAIYLSNICKNVTLIHRNNNYRAEEYLIEELKQKANVTFAPNEKVEKLNTKDGFLESIETNNNTYKIKGLFVAIGQVPSIIKIDSLNQENGYIIVNEKMETNIKGIYACGDCIKKDVYQLTTAAAEGTIASFSIISRG